MVSRLLSLGLREYAEILSKIAYHRHALIDKACGRSSPTDSVGKNLNNIFVVEGVAVLVTGLEVEDLAETALEGNTGAHYVTGLVPAGKYYVIGITDTERLGVKLLTLEVEVCGDALGNRVRGQQSPHDLIYVLAPRKRAGRTYKLIKGLRSV